ncbi:hypothetical protein [Sulfitobacter sp. PS-8MA]|uniref:hypothetical protein n=1 Tax=Sulfitobacter sp. PS-8MA TaxID=3237707 RepID=UPI0034C69383
MTRNAPKSKSTNNCRAPGRSGSAHSFPLEVTRENGSVTASGLADPGSSQPTQVAVHFDGASLSISAAYQPKWRSTVEGAVTLPLDMKDPSPLLPILEGKKPWKAWPEIEALVRQAFVDLKVPRRLVMVFDRHLHALRAVRNGPEKSKMLRALSSDKAREKALFMLKDVELDKGITESMSEMRKVLNTGSIAHDILSTFSGELRCYQELLHEKKKRELKSKRERWDDDLRRLEEEDRSRQRMKRATTHRA